MDTLYRRQHDEPKSRYGVRQYERIDERTEDPTRVPIMSFVDHKKGLFGASDCWRWGRIAYFGAKAQHRDSADDTPPYFNPQFRMLSHARPLEVRRMTNPMARLGQRPTPQIHRWFFTRKACSCVGLLMVRSGVDYLFTHEFELARYRRVKSRLFRTIPSQGYDDTVAVECIQCENEWERVPNWRGSTIQRAVGSRGNNLLILLVSLPLHHATPPRCARADKVGIGANSLHARDYDRERWTPYSRKQLGEWFGVILKYVYAYTTAQCRSALSGCHKARQRARADFRFQNTGGTACAGSRWAVLVIATEVERWVMALNIPSRSFHPFFFTSRDHLSFEAIHRWWLLRHSIRVRIA
ncbi:hypothetical protein V8E53_001644 [Lactarius tabidus]